MIPTSAFWAKLERDEAGCVSRWHSVLDHSADVAAVFEALVALPVYRSRLATLGGQPICEALAAQLCVLAALHDAGKFNHGFQARRDVAPRFWAGHERESLALIAANDAHTERLGAALQAAGLAAWGDQALVEFLVAAFAHHGRPRAVEALSDLGPSMTALWGPSADRDPMAGVANLVQMACDWFPAAVGSGAAPLPNSRPLQHAFSGLLTLADWLASDVRFFPLAGGSRAGSITASREAAAAALSSVGLDARAPARALAGRMITVPALWGFSARGSQQLLEELPVPTRASLTVLEAPTGNGKTEAALLHFLRLFRAGAVGGMYFALPTRAAATQIHQRVVDAVQRAFPEGCRPAVVMAVPGYLRVDETDGQRLPGHEVLWPDEAAARAWAAEHPKRYLAGTIVVGTIDQVLLASLQVRHAHMRAGALLRHLLVVDEVHASDVYMTELLTATLRRHLDAGGHALLMSATLGGDARERYVGLAQPASGACAAPDRGAYPYPAVTQAERGGPATTHPLASDGPPREVRLEGVPASGPEAVAALAVDAARQGARVLVLHNIVDDARATHAAVERLLHGAEADMLLRCNGVSAPHHSRYSPADRHLLDRAVEAALGKGAPARGLVLVATQTVEQSLDIDADLLITDLCPIDVLLQRIGRLHRHLRHDRPAAYAVPTVQVRTPAERDLGSLIKASGKAQGGAGLGTVYTDLRIIEATWRAMEHAPSWALPSTCRALVEAATDPGRLTRLADELGGPWPSHSRFIAGIRSAHGQHARINLIDWDLPWTDKSSLFPDPSDVDVQTRLGERDRVLVLDPPQPGPFGELVRELTVPHRWVRHVAVEEPVRVTGGSGNAVDIAYGELMLRYDRTGLSRRTL
jgi:CRISPR-associated endonuclease/helicase Cas3